VCDWYEQLGSYIKYGLIDEEVMLDVSASSTNAAWAALEPVIRRMRRTRSEALYENFEYYVARGVLFQRAHPRLLSEEHTAHGAARQRAQVRPSDRGGGRAEREAGFARPPQARRVLFVTRLRRGSRGSPGGARSRAPCACRGTARCEREIRICFAGG
jgi:hypothetical protein